jgi:hypothetical protein
MKAGLIVLTSSFLVFACASTPPQSQAPSCNLETSFARRDNLRDQRYCEILLFTGHGNNISGCVYNTIGLNDCPPARWNAIDANELKRRLGASAIILNGPRHFMMDSNAITTASPDTYAFGGIEMHPLATVEVPPGGLLGEKQTPYTESTVDRRTEYVYLAGRPVYELRSPEGAVYVMQSYSQIVDPTLTAAQLPALGSKLNLPAGWTYGTRVPASDLILRSGGSAQVLQDDLQNSYQKMD